MAKPSRPSSLDRALESIVRDAAAAIGSIVRDNIAREVQALLERPGPLGLRAPRMRQRRVIVCPVPECGKPGGGPKWGWFCAEHKDLPPHEKEHARTVTRARPRPRVRPARRRPSKG